MSRSAPCPTRSTASAARTSCRRCTRSSTRMAAFADGVRSGEIKGVGGKFTDVVNIGIGGSDLGPRMAVARAPRPGTTGRACISSPMSTAPTSATRSPALDPARTLFLVASKTFTTIETMTNAATARALDRRGARRGAGRRALRGDVDRASPRSRNSASREDRTFGFWDWVGGRYSIWSAIGLPLMIAIGPANFTAFLAGGALDGRSFPLGAARAEHAGDPGADRHLVPQRARLPDLRGAALRPAAGAAARLSPAARHGDRTASASRSRAPR